MLNEPLVPFTISYGLALSCFSKIGALHRENVKQINTLVSSLKLRCDQNAKCLSANKKSACGALIFQKSTRTSVSAS